jgi:hypothetical protein
MANQREMELNKQIEDLTRRIEMERLMENNEKDAQNTAQMLWMNYQAFIDIGFSEDQAYELLLERIRMSGRK